ncbi:MAG: SMI1/KNR4 family protein [Alphaproteobacteria bacterium]|nr:SMI1/KNR4 family protein [Alphaproteobacteria bacterium]MCB9796854.1 SMI1/KNR4 family protein [Alphaproteobacteria bacterium]
MDWERWLGERGVVTLPYLGRSLPRPSDALLDAAEEAIGRPLPPAFRAWAQQRGGGRLNRFARLLVPAPEHPDEDLIAFQDSVHWVRQLAVDPEHPDALPFPLPRIVALGDTPARHLLVIDRDDPREDPPVYLFPASPPPRLIYLASSFEGLVKEVLGGRRLSALGMQRGERPPAPEWEPFTDPELTPGDSPGVDPSWWSACEDPGPMLRAATFTGAEPRALLSASLSCLRLFGPLREAAYADAPALGALEDGLHEWTRGELDSIGLTERARAAAAVSTEDRPVRINQLQGALLHLRRAAEAPDLDSLAAHLVEAVEFCWWSGHRDAPEVEAMRVSCARWLREALPV